MRKHRNLFLLIAVIVGGYLEASCRHIWTPKRKPIFFGRFASFINPWVVEIMNLAHGDFLSLGLFICLSFCQSNLGMDPLVSIIPVFFYCLGSSGDL